MPPAALSTGGLKKVWVEYPTVCDGPPARVKVEGEGATCVVKVVLPAALDISSGDDGRAPQARNATDLEFASLEDELLFSLPVSEVFSVSSLAERPAVLRIEQNTGRGYCVDRYIEFGSKWSCTEVRKAIQVQIDLFVAARDAAALAETEAAAAASEDTSAQAQQETASTTSTDPSPSEHDLLQRAHQHRVGARVGSLPREQRMSHLLSHTVGGGGGGSLPQQ